MLQEYKVLRAEIALYQQQQNQSLYFAILGTSALAPAFYALLDSIHVDESSFRRVLLLVFPLFVMINGIAFAERSWRVKRVALYLHSCLRPKLIDLIPGYHVWHWEFFKEVTHTLAKGRGRALAFVLDWFRVAFFWLATLLSWIFYGLQSIPNSNVDCTIKFGCTAVKGGFKCTYMAGCTRPEAILLVLNFVIFLVFLFASREIGERAGASSDVRLNRAIDARSEKQIRESASAFYLGD